jgi:hypothetical protein
MSSLLLWLTWFWFTNRSLLRMTNDESLRNEWQLYSDWLLTYEWITTNFSSTNQWRLSLSLILRPTVSRPVCLGIKHPTGAYDQIFITVRQLRFCWCGALSLIRGRVCRLELLLVLASAVNFGSESRRTHNHILLSQIRDFPFHRLLRLARLRWRYSTPSPHGRSMMTPQSISCI